MTPIENQLAPHDGWIVSTSTRIKPLAPAQMNIFMRLLLWGAAKWGARKSANIEVPGIFLVLMRHRRLFWPWLRFASRLMPYGSLDRRDAELVILRVGWNCRCRYEWGQHVQIGLRAGLGAQQIARVAIGSEAAGWTPRQAALLKATDELHNSRLISEQTWQLLKQHYGSAQLIEISLLIGHYEMLAGFLNSIGLQLEPRVEAALARAPIHG